MKKKLILTTVACSATMMSCNDDITSIVPSEYLDITYNGIKYSKVPTAYDKEGEFLFLDDDFSKIFDSELRHLSTLSIYLVSDNEIKMYRDLQSNLKDQDLELIPVDLTRSTIVSPNQNFIALAYLYDDKNFKDRHLEFGMLTGKDLIYEPNLKSQYAFNDKCSSITLMNYLPNDATKILDLDTYDMKYSEAALVLIGYDDVNFGDRTYTCIANPSETKQYKELKNFNDKMSSLQMFYAKKGTYTKEGASK